MRVWGVSKLCNRQRERERGYFSKTLGVRRFIRVFAHIFLLNYMINCLLTDLTTTTKLTDKYKLTTSEFFCLQRIFYGNRIVLIFRRWSEHFLLDFLKEIK